MKKTAWILTAVFLLNGSASFSTSVAAQSNKPVFIDSPAYVLQNGRSDAAADKPQPMGKTPDAAADKPQPMGKTPDAAAKPEAKAAESASRPASQPTVAPQAAPQTADTYTADTYTAGRTAKPDKAPKSAKNKAPNPLARQGKLVYVSIDVAPVINWYAHIARPFDRKGAQVIVNPTVSIDFDLGYYMFIGTGLSFNTIGGRLQFPSQYVQQIENLGFSCYDQMLRTYSASYIELPVVFRAQSGLMHNWRVFGSVGGHFGIRVLAKYKDRFDDFKAPAEGASHIDGTLIRSGKFNKAMNLWSVALGLKFGASYQLADALSLRFGVGYRYGFLDALSKQHERPDGVYPHMKPQQFEFFVGLTF
ncbi:MAG: outer membrane beta-barrel protein [Bacteroidales bacterium]|nr:outer membrane beta-barrel protein [Bacteroidales bacterium]